jgi:hypothetical protein
MFGHILLRCITSWRERRAAAVLTLLDRPDLLVDAGHGLTPRCQQQAFDAAWWMRFHTAAG